LCAILEEAPAEGPAPRRIRLGIGDDAAAWRPSRSHLSVIGSDALVDGVHFRSDAMEARAIGHRAMAANLSDIAAMGACPVLATVALGVGPAAGEDWILDCYRGMHALARRYGTAIVGGDIVRSPATLLSITVVGEVAPSHLCTRDGGKPGDLLVVTGPLGASRAGLEVMRRSLDLDDTTRAAALRAFAEPEPRIAEGRWLGRSVSLHAMLDCSDGLALDVSRLARASGCGATLLDIPIAAAATAVALAAGDDAHRYALEGGEDFELIAAIAPRALEHLAERFERHFGRPLIPIGRLDPEPGLRLMDTDGSARDLAPSGWDHLSGEWR
jgi:thiamine-monophosphate kinase